MIDGLDNLLSFPGEYRAKIITAVQLSGKGVEKDVKTRVHVKGTATDGSRIDKGKGYSKKYGERRAAGKVRKGTGPRPVQFVNLDLTGVMRISLDATPTATGYVLQYPGGGKREDGVTAAQKLHFAERNKRWGNPSGRKIVDPTEAEIGKNLTAALNDVFDQ